MAEQVANTELTGEIYRMELSETANKLRQANVLCDVVLRVYDQQFPAHRCILAASSLYFRSLFTSEMKEKLTGEVSLSGLSPHIMEEVLSFIYTGKVLVSEENAQELICAADYLLITSLKDVCSDILGRSLTTENCFVLRAFAEQYNCLALKETSTKVIFKNFVEVSKTAGFLSLDKTAVQEIFSSDELVVSKEEEVYEALIDWLKHDYECRVKYFEELFTYVRLSSVSKYYLDSTVGVEPLVENSFHCVRLLMAAFKAIVFGGSEIQKPRKSVKGSRGVVICGGSTSGSNCGKHVLLFSPTEGKWTKLSEMSTTREEHSAASVEGSLFVLGGTSGFTTYLDSVEVYHPSANAWFSASRMPHQCYSFTAVALHGQIFVMGGVSANEGQTRRVFRYCPSEDVWLEVAQMHTVRAGACSVALSNRIYVLCGTNEHGEFLSSAERFNPEVNEWDILTPMQIERSLACAVVHDGRILIVGGSNSDGSLASCEIYNPQSDEWGVFAALNKSRKAAAIARVEGEVYVFGGDGGPNFNPTDSVECYDERRNEWRIVGPMPIKLAYSSCGVLKLGPKLLRN